MLSADKCCFARFGCGDCLQELWQERTDILNAVAWRCQDDNAEINGREILLIWEVAVSRNKNVEVGRCEGKKRTIFCPGPSTTLDGFDMVADEQRHQVVRKRFVKQHAHSR